MSSRGSFCNQDTIQYFIDRAKACEESSPYEARAWFLTGTSIAPNNFNLRLEAYAMEKRLKNVDEAVEIFETLFKKFMNRLDDEIGELGNAVRNHHMNKVKETEEDLFLLKLYSALSKDIQMELLMQRAEHSTVTYEKCQFMLLLVKLYPDTVDQHGADLLFNILACESNAFSTFRSLLVVELVPAVLQLSKNLGPSPRLITLLNQCIEYYAIVQDATLAARTEDFLELNCKRWDELFSIIDQIGVVLSWKISPFFSSANQSSSSPSLDSLYQAVAMAFQHRSHYTTTELAYVTGTLFLRCLVTYNQLINSSTTEFGEQLTLVEVFTPRPSSGVNPDPSLPVLTTVSPCSNVVSSQAYICQYFLTAVKLWQLITAVNVKGERLEKEFFEILHSMKTLNVDSWKVFQEFLLDFRLYTGQHYAADANLIQNPLQLASYFCSLNNYPAAVEMALKAVEAIQRLKESGEKSENGNSGTLAMSNSEDFSFFNPHIYDQHDRRNYKMQKRFHFLSENRNELIFYVGNILIRCFHDTMLDTNRGDKYLGHLLTLLQLEWYSPSAELVVLQILEQIRRKGSFSYFPYFSDYIITVDFLEEFMAIANNESKTVLLDLFSGGSGGAGSRRMATRGGDKGAKNEFKQSMMKQILRSGRENIENLIVKFLTVNREDILRCFDTAFQVAR